MINRRVGNTGSEPGPGPGLSMGPRGRVLDNRPPIDRSIGAVVGSPAGPTTLSDLPFRPSPRGMKSGGKVGSSCMKSGGKVGGAMKGGDMPFFASKAKDKMASKKKPARKPMTKYASGGMVKADGMAMKGKTRGREC